MSEQLDVLREVVRRLEGAGIPYMVSGSIAMNFYAQPRMTRDIDLIVELCGSDATRLCELFSKDFYIDETDVRESIAQRGMFNIIHNGSIVKVDFIIRKEEPYRRTEFKRRRTMMLQGFPIVVAAPEDLILSKLFWAKESQSQLQMMDARNLIESVADLDRTYLGRWAAELGISDSIKKLGGA